MQCPPSPGPGIERHEAERLRRRGVDHVPDVDAHLAIDMLQFVDERDVDATEDVFGQLHRFRRGGRRDGNNPLDQCAIERLGERAARVIVRAYDLRNVRGVEIGIAGIFALRRKGEEYVAADHQPARLQNGLHHFVRRAGIGRQFQADQLAGAQRAGDIRGRRAHEGQVRLAMAG